MFIHSQLGHTFIEIMVSLLLAVLMTAAIYQQMVACHLWLKNLQISTSYLLDLDGVVMKMKNDIHMATSMGCAAWDNHILNANDRVILFDHAILIKHMSTRFTTLRHVTESPLRLIAGSEVIFHQHDLALMTDCVHISLFRIQSVSFTSAGLQIITPVLPMTVLNQPYTEIYKVENDYYYLNHHAVYLRDTHHRVIKLADGVDDMSYSIMNDEKGNRVIDVSMRAKYLPNTLSHAQIQY